MSGWRATASRAGSSLLSKADSRKYRISYTGDRPDEILAADRVTVEGAHALIVLHREVLVMGSPREVVVQRVAGADESSVEEQR